MSKEKVILSFVAIMIGLTVAGVGFYLYQTTKALPQDKQESSIKIKPSSTPLPTVLLVIDEPKDEKVVDNPVVKIVGKTDPEAMIVILTDSDEQVLNPTASGDFSTTVTLEKGANIIEITAVGQDGNTNSIERTVTYTTDAF